MLNRKGYVLMPHQIEDAQILADYKSIPNFSEAGCGKTVTTMEGIRLAKINSGIIVGPPIALLMWQRELEAYLGCKTQVIKSGATKIDWGADFHIMSYDIAGSRKIWSQFMEGRSVDVLIADEAHYVKNKSAQRTVALFGKDTDGSGLYDKATDYWPLTATPVMKYPDDMWSQLVAANYDVLKEFNVETFEKFRSKFCILRMKKFHPRAAPTLSVVAGQNLELLNKIVYKEVGAIRRLLKDIEPDMPAILEREVFVKIAPSADLKALLAGMSAEEVLEGLLMEDKGLGVALHMLNLAKAEVAIDYIEECAAHGPILLGNWHHDVGDLLVERLSARGLTVGRVVGGQSLAQRDKVLQDFNDGGINVLVGQISALGVSANLQKVCRHVIILEDQFSAGVIEQFIGRVARLGQKYPVQVDWIKADSVVDDTVTTIRERKKDISKEILK